MINCNETKKKYVWIKILKGVIKCNKSCKMYIFSKQTFDQTLIIAFISSTTWKLIKVKITWTNLYSVHYILGMLQSLTDSMWKLLRSPFSPSLRKQWCSQTSGKVGSSGVNTPWTSASTKYCRVLCMLYFDRHQCCDI